VRKIAQPLGPHNAPARRAAAILVLVFGAALVGCQGSRSATTAPAAHVAQRCALVVDTSGLDAFWAVADHLQAAPDTPTAAVGAQIADLPVWRRWRESYAPNVISSVQLGLILRAAVLGPKTLPPDEARKLVRRDIVRSQNFTLAQRAHVQEFVKTFVAEETACGAWSLARAWVRPAALPDTLRVDLMAGNAEIRLFEGHYLVDAGLALVCGREQTTRLLASVLYRKLEAPDGPSPGEVKGDAVLTESLRLIRNEGIAAYIDDLPNLFFGREHPSLAGAAPVPEDVCATARLNLLYIEQVVAGQLPQPAAARNFEGVHLNLVGSRGWQATGWFMGTVIARRLGEPRLQAAARSVADFLTTYQEPALANPPQSSAAPGTLDYFVETAPTFSPPVLAVLRQSLGEPR
jgi:hypothetical protein